MKEDKELIKKYKIAVWILLAAYVLTFIIAIFLPYDADIAFGLIGLAMIILPIPMLVLSILVTIRGHYAFGIPFIIASTVLLMLIFIFAMLGSTEPEPMMATAAAIMNT
jgi:hypothetical protein